MELRESIENNAQTGRDLHNRYSNFFDHELVGFIHVHYNFIRSYALDFTPCIVCILYNKFPTAVNNGVN